MTTLVNGQPVTVIIPGQGTTPLISSTPGVGAPGPPGPQGYPGVYVGTVPPADHSLLWVDTN